MDHLEVRAEPWPGHLHHSLEEHWHPQEPCPFLPGLWGHRLSTYLFLLLSLMNTEWIFFFFLLGAPARVKYIPLPSPPEEKTVSLRLRLFPQGLENPLGARLRIDLSFFRQMMIRNLLWEGGRWRLWWYFKNSACNCISWRSWSYGMLR